ncbi:serine hydrolase domain-containing protein [Streptomyces avicenniae]|uniref:serine hydrolase domain-containing protein n=1 Tax=Streptomyces avicenniae TaxID=500153 RepID=UPI0006995FA4|nr:serine hydrolase domain-containing protein [Streptomyces avicenniae]
MTRTTHPVPQELRPGGTFDRFLAERAAADAFSGTVLLTHRRRTVLARSFGLADKRRRVPNGPRTRFALASVTKLLTAAAVHRLARRGALTYLDPLATHLPGLPPELAALTLDQLLTHTSGLGDYRATPAFREQAPTWADAAAVNDGIMAIIRSSPPELPPGTGFRYSNSGYELLGAVVAKAAGQPYLSFVHEHVLGPAGMRDTAWHTRTQWADDRRIAHPYALAPPGDGDDGGARVDVLADKPFIGTAAGDAFSTASDMSRFCHAVLDGTLLGAAHTRMFLSGKLPLGPWRDAPDTAPPEAAFQGYGPLGLLLDRQWVALHNGGSAGEGAYVELHPGSGWVTVVLSNYDVQAVVPVTTTVRRILTAHQSA